MKLHESTELFEDLILKTGGKYTIEHARIFGDTDNIFTDKRVISAYKKMQILMMRGKHLPPIETIHETIKSMQPRMKEFDKYNKIFMKN